jgi:hypothetical protein
MTETAEIFPCISLEAAGRVRFNNHERDYATADFRLPTDGFYSLRYVGSEEPPWAERRALLLSASKR